MINLVLYAALAFIGVKMFGQAKAATGGTTSTGGVRTASAMPGTSSVNVRVASNNPGQGAGSGSKNTLNTNANQPWYTGPLIAGAGLGAAQIAKGLASLSFASTDTSDEPDISEEDLAAIGPQMESSTSTSTADNEDPGTLSDNSGDTSGSDPGSDSGGDTYA